MTDSFTITQSQTFTLTHARHMAAKVSTDLRRLRSFYGVPTEAEITRWEAEIIEFLKTGYLGTLTIGFRRHDQWIEPTLRYTARDLAGGSANDDDPGGIPPRANIDGAHLYNYLTYSSAWHTAQPAEKEAFRQRLPFQRADAAEPTISGTLVPDRTYSAGGHALGRAVVRSR